MFSFFKKKDKKKIAKASDKIWIHFEEKYKGIEGDINALVEADQQLFICYYFESSKTLIENILSKIGIDFTEADRSNVLSKVNLVNVNDLVSSSKLHETFGKISDPDKCEFLFPEHYPLFSKESVVLEEIGRLLNYEPTVQFYVGMDEPLMQQFGSERIIKMMQTMGHKEGEFIQHQMISKSIQRAQQKLDESSQSDNRASSAKEWFQINVRE